MDKYKNKLGPYQLMVASQYFNDINDFKHLELATPTAKDNMEKFHFNPIPLNQDTIKYFTQLETLHAYYKGDEEFRNEHFYKRIIHYQNNYQEYCRQGENVYYTYAIDDKKLGIGIIKDNQEKTFSIKNVEYLSMRIVDDYM